MPRLLISAAHTLENPGEVFGDLREADITRNILKKTLPYLESKNIEFQAVPLDLQLLKRIDWIKSTGYSKEQGDIFIEIHVNDGGKRGIEGWFDGAAVPNNNSKVFAESIVNSLCKTTGYQNQGVKSEYEHDLGSLIILNQSNLIATAIELLYIDNPEDVSILKDDSKLESLAKTLADSVQEYVINVAPTLKYTATKGLTPLPQSGFQPNSFQNSNQSVTSPFANPIPSYGTTAPNKPILMDREERKEMIKKTFLKVLGKEPSQNDLNYYLNTGIAETDLIKKLIEGEEHTKIIQNANEFKELSDKVAKLNAEVDQLKTNGKDTKLMQESMNRLLEHKNLLIARLHQELARNNIIVHGGHIDSLPQVKPATYTPNSNTVKKKRSFGDFLSDIFKL
jgi:hypothetical protein